MTFEIKNIVEKIVFNEEKLLELKEALSQFRSNKLGIKHIKNMILDQRTQIMEDTIDLLNFYKDQRATQSEEIPSEKLLVLQASLKEREDLLKEIGRRLERLTSNSFS